MNPKNAVFAFGTGLAHENLEGCLARFAVSLGKLGYMVYADDNTKSLFESYGNTNVFPLDHQTGNPDFHPTVCVVDAYGVRDVTILNPVDGWYEAGTLVLETSVFGGSITCDFILPLLSIDLDAKVVSDEDSQTFKEKMREVARALYDHLQTLREIIPVYESNSRAEDRASAGIGDAFICLAQDQDVLDHIKSIASVGHHPLLDDWLLLAADNDGSRPSTNAGNGESEFD
jgi:hypothetical protein